MTDSERYGEYTHVTNDDVISNISDSTDEDYDEMMNDCDHGRFYCDWSQCHYKDCPLDEDMKIRIENCRLDCVAKIAPLGLRYEMKMPDRMYALRTDNCVCGSESQVPHRMGTICTCSRPKSKTLDYEEPLVLDAPPFTAIDITLDCEHYDNIKKVYEALGTSEDKVSANDDRVYVFCLRKAYYDRFSEDDDVEQYAS